MSSTTHHIIVLATAWGPKHGGINAFNVEWIKSLGITPRRNFDLTCLVLQASEADHADARASHVTLVALGIDGKDMGVNLTEQSQTALNAHLKPGTGTQVIWVGHDDKTGPLALALRDGLPGSKAVLFNHMAFGAYQAFKKGNPKEAAEKKAFQRALFSRADLCFAVGPMLEDHLRELLSTVKHPLLWRCLCPALLSWMIWESWYRKQHQTTSQPLWRGGLTEKMTASSKVDWQWRPWGRRWPKPRMARY